MRFTLGVALLLLCAGCEKASTLTYATDIPVSAVSAAPSTCCTLSGTVTADGVRIANALVDLLGTGQPGHYTFTRADGSFRLPGTPKGPIVLRIGKWGFKTQVITSTIDGDVSRDVNLQPGDLPASIAIGATVTSAVRLDDTICATSDPGLEDGEGGLGLVGPCKTYLLNIPRDGTLAATATWPGSGMYMTVITALHGKCCSSPLTLRFPVTAGSAIELGVSIHGSDMLSLGTTAPFELTVRLDP